jgi:hypothetical protein
MQEFPLVDACIGNPPYVRYQSFAGDARKRGREAALAAGVRVDGLASSWAPFTVHAASFLKPGGRLGLVLPAELMSVNYAAPVRRFLLERFGSVRVVLFEERVFPGVLEEVVLLLAEGTGPCDRFSVVQVEGLADLPSLEKRTWSSSPDAGKWTGLLLPDSARHAVATVELGDAFQPLGEVASVSVGMVTGNNHFFCLTDADRASANLTPAQALPMLPPGSKSLRGLQYGESDWTEARSSGERTWLFYPTDHPSNAARAYVRHGELAGLNQAYKCRVRTPWYRVPLVKPPDLFMVYMADSGPRFVENRAGVLNVNSVHGLHIRSGHRRDKSLLPAALLSTFSLLGAELCGRAYGGGLLKLEPREALGIPVPSSGLLADCRKQLTESKPALDLLLRSGHFEDAVQLVDRILLQDGMGLSVDDLEGLRAGRRQMFGRRRKRSKG